ncbi:MAG: alpha/beta hydrolase [Actinomycetota bacterium]|nr:alpha/beta hydrolase [Actinomycetota bacterium]
MSIASVRVPGLSGSGRDGRRARLSSVPDTGERLGLDHVDDDLASWVDDCRTVHLGRVPLRVATVGDGPPLLLLNGIGANIEMWQPLAAELPGRRLVMVDMPGTGGSPPLRYGGGMAKYALLVVRLLDRLGLEQVDVLGYSWGGALAQQVAHQAPSRVRSLVLGATVPGLGGRPPAPWVAALMATPARYHSRAYLRYIAPIVFGSSPHRAADSLHGSARLRRPPSGRGYAQQLYAISHWSSLPFLRQLPHRTLVLAGRRDPLVPHRNAEILARTIPNARLHVVRGGHLFLLDHPREACAVAQAFLSEADARA